MQSLITDLVPFEGDEEIRLVWDNFSNIVRNSLQRLLWRLRGDEDWRKGLAYKYLRNLTLEDISDMPNVGPLRRDQIVSELRAAFETFEVEGPQGTISPLIEYEELEASEPDSIDQARNLEQLVDGILEYFNDYRVIDVRTREILRARVPAFERERRTLEDLGVQFGVTRERVRQIEAKYLHLHLGVARERNDLLAELISLLEKSNNEREFITLAKGADLLGDEKLTLEKMNSICEILEIPTYVSRIAEVKEGWQSDRVALSALGVIAREVRTKFGLIDLEVLSAQTGATTLQCCETIKEIYPRTIVKGNLVLARTENWDTAFENALGKQLLVFGALDAGNLLEGIARQAAFRQTPLIGSHAEQIALIEEIAGIEPNYEEYSLNTIESPELSPTDTWLLEVFKESRTGMFHRNEICAAAVRDNKNVSSIGVFLLFNVLIRPVGAGVLALANTTIFPENAKQYADLVRAAEEPTRLEFSFRGSDLMLSFEPNITTIGAGVLFPSSELRQLVKGTVFTCTCNCGLLSTKQQLKLTSDYFWTGFTAIIRHGMTIHNYGKRATFDVLLDFETRNAVFLND